MKIEMKKQIDKVPILPKKILVVTPFSAGTDLILKKVIEEHRIDPALLIRLGTSQDEKI